MRMIPAAPARAGRDDAPGRCLGDRGQDGRALDEAPLRSIGLAIPHRKQGGALTKASAAPTAQGARNPIVDANGIAYVADRAGGRLIVVEAPATP